MSYILDQLYRTLIVDKRYMLLLEGLKNTLIIASCATAIGVAIGLLVAIVKVTAQNNRKWYMVVLDKICSFYVTVIRGTPVVVQLLIMNGSIMAAVNAELLVAILTFGINSGAYVAEIIRAGIMAVDKGQAEAGRSLGLTQSMTMKLIVLPQAVKNILPALGNEFIALLKETSVAGYIAIRDLTKAGDNIFSRVVNSTPLYIVAIIYLVLVMGLSYLLKLFERRLAKSDHR